MFLFHHFMFSTLFFTPILSFFVCFYCLLYFYFVASKLVLIGVAWLLFSTER
uniref:Uncharacterized protein n=1 Tax=Arundo donax TaxID=35708 RepID=A0A0A8YPJ1_ARUDO